MKKKIIIVIGLFFMSFICLFSNLIFQNNKTQRLEVYDVLDEDVNIDKSGKKKEKNIAFEANNKISNILAQVSEEIDGKRSIRVLAGIDSYLYNDAKFDIIVKNGEEIYKTFENKAITRAYTHVIANGVKYSASEAFGDGYNFLIALTVNNVPEYAWGYTFEVVASIRKTVNDPYTSSNVGYKIMQDMIDADEGLESLKFDVNVQFDNTECSINGQGSYRAGTSVNLSVEEKAGYIFIGWYKDNELISKDAVLSFSMPEENLSYNVKFARKTSNTTYEFEGVVYTSSGSQLTVTGYTENILSEITILSKIDNFPVYIIDERALYSCKTINSVIIEDGIIMIKQSAFEKCDNLEKITLPFIGYYAGSGTSHFGYIFGASSYSNNNQYVPKSLKEVKITGGTNIAANAFSGCANLLEVNIPNTVTNIAANAFQGCTNLSKVNIPDTVREIGNIAFQNTGIIDLVIPGSVKSIGYYAFGDCSSLTNLEIQEGVKTIADKAFVYCGNLASIKIPSTVTSIGLEAFAYTGSLENIVIDEDNTVYDSRDNCNAIIETSTNKLIVGSNNTVIPEGVKTIGAGAFSYKNIKEIEIPNSVRVIEDSAFSHCSNLKHVKLSDNLESINYYAFGNCESLTSIDIPNSVKTLGTGLFNNNHNLERVVLPDSIETIPNSLFMNCWSLGDIVIPKTVTSINANAFSNCHSLYSIVIPNSVTSIGQDTFYNCEKLTIYCEGLSVQNGWNVSWNSFDRPVYFGISLNDVYTINGMQYIIQNNEVVITRYIGTATHIYIPRIIENNGKNYDVTTIGESSFTTITGLKSVTIPNNIKYIGNNAFIWNEGLAIYCETEVKPDGWNDFIESFSTLYFGITSDEVITIDDVQYIIQDDKAHITRYVGNKDNVVLPTTINFNGLDYVVSSIEKSAFFNSETLKTIYIPSNIEKIGDYAFSYCINLEIYCEAESKPIEWSNTWCELYTPIYWNVSR